MRVLIKNGTVVNADGQAKQDLLIESGIVRQLGNNISPQLPYEEIDATGCYVFPGGVDVHLLPDKWNFLTGFKTFTSFSLLHFCSSYFFRLACSPSHFCPLNATHPLKPSSDIALLSIVRTDISAY